MEIVQTIANKIMTVVSLLTAFGVFLHDGRVDKAAITAAHRPFEGVSSSSEVAVRFKSFIQTDAHTHPDHNAAKSAYFNSFKYQSPSVPPRRDQEHKHVLDELEAGGRHAFDNANLPIIDVA